MTLTTIRSHEAIETTVVGVAPDEAARIGLLKLLCDLSLSLTSVQNLGADALEEHTNADLP